MRRGSHQQEPPRAPCQQEPPRALCQQCDQRVQALLPDLSCFTLADAKQAAEAAIPGCACQDAT